MVQYANAEGSSTFLLKQKVCSLDSKYVVVSCTLYRMPGVMHICCMHSFPIVQCMLVCARVFARLHICTHMPACAHI